jgi:toxin ParE1/3/4
MKLVLTEAALNDLRSIRAYTVKTWGAAQEERYLRTLWSRIQTLSMDPLRYRLRDDLFPGCRITNEGRHFILFRANSEGVQIVRILHCAMDFSRQFPPDPA